MGYRLRLKESAVLAEKQFVNASGHTECVEFVRQAAGAPRTALWTKGDQVLGASIGSIPRGTAIATFDAKGNYPIDGKGKHAAIYLSHNAKSIQVLDQLNGQGRVLARSIRAKPSDFPRSDAAQCFSIIE